MYRTWILWVGVLLFSAVMATAEDGMGNKPSEAKERSTFPAALAAVGDANSGEQPAVSAAAEDANRAEPSEAKELSGMSIVGNDEAPKSLYIVPWKSSEIGAETSLDTMLNEGDVPVDRDVFKRQLGFYHVSTGK